MRTLRLYEEPAQKNEDYKDRFRYGCLFSPRAASQTMEILYLVELVCIHIKGIFGRTWNDLHGYM